MVVKENLEAIPANCIGDGATTSTAGNDISPLLFKRKFKTFKQRTKDKASVRAKE